jgi:hypothetical protein
MDTEDGTPRDAVRSDAAHASARQEPYLRMNDPGGCGFPGPSTKSPGRWGAEAVAHEERSASLSVPSSASLRDDAVAKAPR